MHRTTDELTTRLDYILDAPKDEGRVELIVRRPEVDAREVITTAKLTPEEGLVGDNWSQRPSRSTGAPIPDAQLTVMNSRVLEAIAGDKEQWPQAGDQIYVDLDISAANLPPGTRLAIGDAVIEITAQPHTGCPKFAARFGAEALRFVNVGIGKEHRFRGVNAKVVESGAFEVGDAVTRV